jgi:purine nucleosidase
MSQRSFVIDTDTASDDAVALLLAATDPSVSIRAVTVVAGNVPLDLAVKNALATLALVPSGEETPVASGLAKPIIRPLETAQMVHGEDGMGGAPLPPPRSTLAREHAVDMLRRIADAEPGQHELITLGPLSNVAAALLIDPLLLTKFRNTTMMLGSPDGVGNVTVLGEYNAWADPEAAAVVLDAPGRKTMVGWNISRLYAVVDPSLREQIRASGRLGEFVCDINVDVDHYARIESGLAGFDLPDPIAVAIAIDPTIATKTTFEHVAISCDPVTRGLTIIDRRHTAPPANCTIVWEANAARFQAQLLRAAAAPASSAVGPTSSPERSVLFSDREAGPGAPAQLQ